MGRSRCSPFRTATAHTRERELRASPYPQLGSPQVVVSAHPPSPGGAHAAYRLARSWPAARLSGGGALADRRAEEDTRCTARVGRLRGRVATALRGAARRTATPPYVALRRAAFRRRAGVVTDRGQTNVFFPGETRFTKCTVAAQATGAVDASASAARCNRGSARVRARVGEGGGW